jgi:hypothetical protein
MKSEIFIVCNRLFYGVLMQIALDIAFRAVILLKLFLTTHMV